jgi:hypothetical protein
MSSHTDASNVVQLEVEFALREEQEDCVKLQVDECLPCTPYRGKLMDHFYEAQSALRRR